MANKIITVKDGDKVIHEFVITEAQLNIAKKLGIGYQEYIIEKTRSELKEKENETNRCGDPDCGVCV
jgi:hypothetical protein